MSGVFDKVQPPKPKQLLIEFKSLSKEGDVWSNPHLRRKFYQSSYQKETVPTNYATLETLSNEGGNRFEIG